MFFAACSKGSDSGGSGSQSALPEAANLTSPANNTACLTGTDVDANSASITFTWQAAHNADSYDLVVKNLISAQTSTYSVSGTSKYLVLNKTQPYSWYVISKSSKTSDSVKSDTWKFYVAGNASSSYAPFPATIISPATNAVVASNGSSPVTVVFQWVGSAVNNDIAFYTVYLDTQDASTVVVKSTAASTASMSLAAGKTYYWRVVTTDAAGNSSDSGVFSFSI